MKALLYVGLGIGAYVVLTHLGGASSVPPPYWSIPPNSPKAQQQRASSAGGFLDDVLGFFGTLGNKTTPATKVPTGSGGVASYGGTAVRPSADGLMTPTWAEDPTVINEDTGGFGIFGVDYF